jgi:hypothetical protein
MSFTLCFGVLVALALIGVGASIVRSARPMSGYLMALAGLLELLGTCCSGFVRGDTLNRFQLEANQLQTIMLAKTVAFILTNLTVGILLAVAIAGLAKAAKAAKPS